MRSDIFVSGLMVLCAVPGWATIDLLSPTNEWLPLPYEGQSVQSDYILDTQANSPDLDLVGYGEQYAAYAKYDQEDSLLAFRARMAGDKNPAGFKGQLWIGADVNLDGNLDIFIGTDASTITLNYGTDTTNTTPNNTAIETGTNISSIDAVSGENFSWTEVTTTNDPFGAYTDIDGTLNSKSKSGTDYFLSLSIDFDEFATAVNSLDYIDGFTSASSVAFVVGTATQGNSLNSDISGIYGSTDSQIAYTTLGAISQEISFEAAVPEPGTTTLLIAGLSFLFIVIQRRRR